MITFTPEMAKHADFVLNNVKQMIKESPSDWKEITISYMLFWNFSSEQFNWVLEKIQECASPYGWAVVMRIEGRDRSENVRLLR